MVSAWRIRDEPGIAVRDFADIVALTNTYSPALTTQTWCRFYLVAAAGKRNGLPERRIVHRQVGELIALPGIDSPNKALCQRDRSAPDCALVNHIGIIACSELVFTLIPVTAMCRYCRTAGNPAWPPAAPPRLRSSGVAAEDCEFEMLISGKLPTIKRPASGPRSTTSTELAPLYGRRLSGWDRGRSGRSVDCH